MQYVIEIIEKIVSKLLKWALIVLYTFVILFGVVFIVSLTYDAIKETQKYYEKK